MLTIIDLRHTDPGFAVCLAIRMDVFVGEQNVPAEEEHDDDDAIAQHFLALVDGSPAGTARLLVLDDGATAKIGRVAVTRSARGTGAGAALMRHIEATCPAARFILDAQLQAAGFYQRLGYEFYGEEFLEAGIPHRRMRKERVKDVS